MYYDIDSEAVWLILDEMEELLNDTDSFIFSSLRRGVSRRELAEVLGISGVTLRKRIERIRRKIRENMRELDLPKELELLKLL